MSHQNLISLEMKPRRLHTNAQKWYTMIEVNPEDERYIPKCIDKKSLK